MHDSERTSAMLHGKPAKPASARNHVGGPSKNQNRSSHPLSSTSSHRPQTKQQSQPPCQKQQGRLSQTDKQPLTSKKRKAEASLNQRPAQRQRGNQHALRPEMKDEAYMRRTMHIPTPEDYPNVSPRLFKSLKESLNDATQGLAKLEFDVKELTNDAFRCTLHYKSAAHEAVVDGEGRSKVRNSYPDTANLLTIYRKVPSMLLLYISPPNSMSRVYSRISWTGTPP
jgi:hypothetical protein